MESYVYLGVGTVVAWDHPQTGVDETYISQGGEFGPAGDDITGLDQFGRVVEDAYINALTGQYTDDFLYTYDADGNVTSMTNALDPSLSQTYTYNGLNELTGYTQDDGTGQSINYDALGNITSTTTGGVQVARTSNAQNEYTSVAGSTASPTYDNNGNLTTDPTTGNQFTYNAWNQLVSVSNDGTVLATFEFDALGRMVAETTGGTTTDMYYNTQGQIIEERVSGQVTSQYVWCPLGTNQLVCMNYDPVNGVPTQRVYIQQDPIGNVMSLVSTSGNVVDRWSYTPFGQSTQYLASDPQIPIAYGFQCMFTYGSLGIAQAGERIYDFSLQVFAQMDPIGMADGSANGYEFVGNNPVNGTDPTGLAQPPEPRYFVEPYEGNGYHTIFNGFGTWVRPSGLRGWIGGNVSYWAQDNALIDQVVEDTRAIKSALTRAVNELEELVRHRALGSPASASNSQRMRDLELHLQRWFGCGRRLTDAELQGVLTTMRRILTLAFERQIQNLGFLLGQKVQATFDSLGNPYVQVDRALLANPDAAKRQRSIFHELTHLYASTQGGNAEFYVSNPIAAQLTYINGRNQPVAQPTTAQLLNNASTYEEFFARWQ